MNVHGECRLDKVLGTGIAGVVTGLAEPGRDADGHGLVAGDVVVVTGALVVDRTWPLLRAVATVVSAFGSPRGAVAEVDDDRDDKAWIVDLGRRLHALGVRARV